MDVIVIETDTEENVTLSQPFTYDFTNTPIVTSVSPNILSVLGNGNSKRKIIYESIYPKLYNSELNFKEMKL